jgi:hypothetical protein
MGNLSFLGDNIHFAVLNSDTTSLLSKDFNLFNSTNFFDDDSFRNLNCYSYKKSLFYLLNVDNFNFFSKNYDNFLKKDQIIFQNMYDAPKSLKDKVNFFLPAANFVEKNATYINFFGMIQKVKFIIFPFKNVRSDFKILYILFKNLFFDLDKKNSKTFNLQKFFMRYNFLNFELFFPFIKLKFSQIFSFNNTIQINNLTNIYKGNSISKRSRILNICYRDVKKIYSNFF